MVLGWKQSRIVVKNQTNEFLWLKSSLFPFTLREFEGKQVVDAPTLRDTIHLDWLQLGMTRNHDKIQPENHVVSPQLSRAQPGWVNALVTADTQALQWLSEPTRPAQSSREPSRSLLCLSDLYTAEGDDTRHQLSPTWNWRVYLRRPHTLAGHPSHRVKCKWCNNARLEVLQPTDMSHCNPFNPL